MTEREMAEVVMRNYDPDFSDRIDPGDVLVGGYNFGTGSSREQAATALQASHATAIGAGARTLIPGSLIDVDFSRGLLLWEGESFRFPALGSVPQGLVVAGGIEKQVRTRLGLGG
jgi:homoaconitate hydratase